MPLSNFNVHFLRVVNPDNENTRDYVPVKTKVSAYKPTDAEQKVREDEIRHGYGFIRGKVKLDLSEAYAKRNHKKRRR